MLGSSNWSLDSAYTFHTSDLLGEFWRSSWSLSLTWVFEVLLHQYDYYFHIYIKYTNIYTNSYPFQIITNIVHIEFKINSILIHYWSDWSYNTDSNIIDSWIQIQLATNNTGLQNIQVYTYAPRYNGPPRARHEK
jgi:hypothetical protein